jgi:hypothetical protein
MLRPDLTKEDGVPEKFVIGRKYHCNWAKSRGLVWILVSFDEAKDEAIMRTPSTRRPMTTKLSSLRDINKFIKPKNLNHINK